MEERTSVVRVAVVSFIGLVVALVIIGIIIWAIFFRAGDSGQTTNAPGGSTSSGGSSAPAPRVPSTSPQTNGNGSNASGSNSTSNNSSTSGKSGSQSNLTNTGPGTTIAVFVASSLLGTVAYQYAIRRRSHARN